MPRGCKYASTRGPCLPIDSALSCRGAQCRTYRTAWPQQNGSEDGDPRQRADAPTKPPVDFHLVWRDNGRRPCTMWEPIPPRGYMCASTGLYCQALVGVNVESINTKYTCYVCPLHSPSPCPTKPRWTGKRFLDVRQSPTGQHPRHSDGVCHAAGRWARWWSAAWTRPSAARCCACRRPAPSAAGCLTRPRGAMSRRCSAPA